MVGFALDSSSFAFAARLWLDEQIYDLQELVVDLPVGITLARAVDINENGDIIVEASKVVDGQIQFVSVLLTPVPAPGAATLLAPASLVLLRRRRNVAD